MSRQAAIVDRRPLVLVSWDGVSTPLALIHLDAAPEFDWVVLDFSCRSAEGPSTLRGQSVHVLARPTQGKGDIFQELAGFLHARGDAPEYVGLVDDDVIIGVSDLNRALHLARCERLDAFSPVLSHDSCRSHRWMLQQPRLIYREVDWVEMMMSFYRGALFLAGREHYAGSVTGWGFDRYLMPTLQQLSGATRTALLDAVCASHRRRLTSGLKRYRNGRTAQEEQAEMKAHCVRLVRERAPHLVGTAWYRRTFTRRKVRTPCEEALATLGRPLQRWLDRST